MSVHVVPTADLIEHDVSGDCLCGPDLDRSGPGDLWVHHSLDGREIEEKRESQ